MNMLRSLHTSKSILFRGNSQTQSSTTSCRGHNGKWFVCSAASDEHGVQEESRSVASAHRFRGRCFALTFPINALGLRLENMVNRKDAALGSHSWSGVVSPPVLYATAVFSHMDAPYHDVCTS